MGTHDDVAGCQFQSLSLWLMARARVGFRDDGTRAPSFAQGRGIDFWKLCGSGSGEGIHTYPQHICLRDSRDMARRGKRDTRDRE